MDVDSENSGGHAVPSCGTGTFGTATNFNTKSLQLFKVLLYAARDLPGGAPAAHSL